LEAIEGDLGGRQGTAGKNPNGDRGRWRRIHRREWRRSAGRVFGSVLWSGAN